ncbi:MAG: PKD domain-containing protein [Bacteroidota bacterium]
MKKFKLYAIVILFLGALFSGHVNAQCTASFIAQSSSNGSVTFTNTSVANSQYTVYYWSFGDGTSSYAANPSHQYYTNGYVSVCLTAYDSLSNCQTSHCDSVLISGASGATCNVLISAQSNGGSSMYFYPSQATSNITTYQWWFGDGGTSSLSNPTHSYSSAGTYTVSLVAGFANGCIDTVYTTVTIANTPSCNAQFTYTQSGGGHVNFINQSTPVGTSATPWISYYWTFGDGSSYWGGNNSHTYTSNGTYQACVWVIDSSTGCSDSYCTNIIITSATGATCHAQYSASSTNGVTTFINQSTPSSGAQVSYVWSFGDNTYTTTYGATPNMTHQYNTSGNYYACLTVIDSSSGCSNQYCSTVTVQVPTGCNASFSSFDSSGYIYFIPNTAPPATYLWNFGDNTTSTSSLPVHHYNAYGTYYVCLTVQTMGMTCTYCDTVLYYGSSPCNANFTAYPDSVTTGLVYFSNNSTGNFTNAYWSFGDGTSSSLLNPVHTYSQQGTYLVCLTVYNNTGCQSSYCDSVIVGNPSGPCTPVFYAFPDSTIGNGVVNFGLINNCGNSGWTYTWNFGDGTSGTGLYPVHVYQTAGTFWVCVDAVDANGNVLTWCDSVNSNRMGSVGLNEIKQNTIIAFPNPANNQVTLKNIGVNQLVDIYSVEGKLIYSGISTTVDLQINTATWNTGLYIVRINEGNNYKMGKISVQH